MAEGHPTDRSRPGARPGGMPQLVLASASPRRAELLEQFGLSFVVEPTRLDETPLPGEKPADYVTRLARAKASHRAGPNRLVLAADTVVVLDGRILGKPVDRDDARRMLRELAGRTHRVLTGTVVRWGNVEAHRVDTTSVTFTAISEPELTWYLASGEPLDKAGAYGLQGAGGAFVARVDGNVQNVIGLSLVTVRHLTAELGLDLRDWVP